MDTVVRILPSADEYGLIHTLATCGIEEKEIMRELSYGVRTRLANTKVTQSLRRL